MENISEGVKLFMAFILGGVIGLEREINEKEGNYHNKPSAVLGIRTFSLVTGLGAIAGLLYLKFLPFAILIAGGFILMLLLFYFLDVQKTKDHGFTTEIAVLYSFLIGLLLMLEVVPIQLVLALTVLIILLLSQKARIKNVVEDIKKTELNAFISFAIIALVILPFLPNTSYSIADIPVMRDLLANVGVNIKKIAELELFNPFKLWLIVALVTGVDLIGYVLERTIGQKRGWLLASAAGGFISSTATTQSLAQESRSNRGVNHLVAAAVLANMVSFFQIAFIIAALSSMFLISLLPVLGLMIAAALITLIYFLRSKEKTKQSSASEKETAKSSEIINLKGALKFTSLFLVISIFSKIALEFFGNSGFLVATGIGALIGLDAVIINTAQLVGKSIDTQLAVWAFILANFVNLAGKTVYSYAMGTREFTIKFGISMALIIVASLFGVLFVR